MEDSDKEDHQVDFTIIEKLDHNEIVDKKDEFRTIEVREFVNGGTLQDLIISKKGPLKEIEIQLVIKKLIQALCQVQDKGGSFHEVDLNLNKVMLHFPKLEPSREDFLIHSYYLKTLENKRAKAHKELLTEEFEIKFTGIIKENKSEITDSVLKLQAIQGVGAVFFALLTLQSMFQDTRK